MYNFITYKMLAVVCLTAAIITIAVTPGTDADDLCPKDWFRYKNYCYKSDTTKVTFWEARGRCQDLGGDLATMVNANETEALERELQSLPGKVDLWIGLYNPTGVLAHGNASGFRWTDGTDFDSSYEIWLWNEPNKYDKFARFYRHNETQPVKWAAAGAVKTGYICKKEIDQCASSPCLNNGTCVHAVNDFGCICAVGYYGKQCEQSTVCLLAKATLPLAALLGIAITVIVIFVFRTRKTWDEGIQNVQTENGHFYDEIPPRRNPPVESIRDTNKTECGYELVDYRMWATRSDHN